ncbi:MAG TPA: LmeA family phospholipid-binding protein [Methylomirabilota bacterium]|nr:LmeA family phospholipid-binding protein [Methylomirabilota bacterium]
MSDGRREVVTVLIGWLTLALLAAVWMAIDRRPPEWDHANHLERAVLCTRDLRAGDWHTIFERSSFYPPLATCAAGALGMLLPADAAAGAALVLFLGVGMFAVYLLARALVSGRAGVAAALLFGAAPFVVFSTLHFQLDLPLASMVALALLLQLASDDFRRLTVAFLVGVVWGLGMLTKPTFALYVAGPALLMLVRGRRQALPGAVLATLLAAAVGLPWFGPRLLGLGAQVDARAFAQAAESGHPGVLTLPGLTFYPRWLGYEFGLLALAFVVAGLVVAAVRRQTYLLVAALGPYIVIELIRNKNLRYSLPTLGALAVVAALGLDALPPRVRRVAAVALVVAGVVQVSAMTTGVPPNRLIPGLDAWWVPQAQPARADWRHRDILALIENDRHGAPVTVSVVPNFDLFSVSNFRYYAVRDGLDMRFVRAWDDPPIGIDYMVFKTGDVGPSWTAEKSRRAAERLAADPSLARVFPVIGEFTLPDGSTASVRARRIPPVPDATPAEVAAAVEAGLRRRLGDVARDVEGLQIGVVHDAGILTGRIARVEVRATAATLGEFTRSGTTPLRVHDIGLVLEDLLVNPWSARLEGRFEPLAVGRLRVESLAVSVGDLQAFIAAQKHFGRSSISVDGDALRMVLRQAGPDVSARVRLAPAADRPFTILADHVWVGWLPVPGALVNWVIRNYDPSLRIAARVPFPVTIGRASIREQALRISSQP